MLVSCVVCACQCVRVRVSAHVKYGVCTGGASCECLGGCVVRVVTVCVGVSARVRIGAGAGVHTRPPGALLEGEPSELRTSENLISETEV